MSQRLTNVLIALAVIGTFGVNLWVQLTIIRLKDETITDLREIIRAHEQTIAGEASRAQARDSQLREAFTSGWSGAERHYWCAAVEKHEMPDLDKQALGRLFAVRMHLDQQMPCGALAAIERGE